MPQNLFSKTAEAEAAHEGERDRAAASTGLCVAVLAGAELRYTHVNEGYAALAPGVPMLGRRFREVFPTEATRSSEARFLHVLETGETWHVDRHVLDLPALADRYWEGEVARVARTEPDGTPGILVMVRDVTERERVAQRLVQRERELAMLTEKLGSTLDRITDGVLVLDRDWRYTHVSERAASIIGVRPEDLLGGVVWELFPHAEGTKFHEGYLRAMATQEPVFFEEYYPAPLDLWLECRCYPTPDELTVYFRDISSYRRAEEALRESTALLRAISDGSSDAIFAKDRDGRMRFANPTTVAITGKPAELVLGKTDLEFLDDEATAREVMATDQRVMSSGEPVEIEEPVPMPDGTVRVWLSRKVPYRDDTGAVIGLLGISRDITERKRDEEKLRASDRRKSEFLAVLSHELRNPLAPILNGLHVLERVPAESPQAERAAEVVRRQTMHLTRLVDDLLDTTRISHGKIALQRSRVDLRDVVRRTTDDVRSVYTRAGVELRLLQVSGPVFVDADPTRLAQVLGNLLQNAVKFTPRGGSVLVAIGKTGGFATLRVKDTGVGMDPATIEAMFEPFAQAQQSLARPLGGLGLGLALVKGLVELHGGKVSATSEGPGTGTEVVVELPAVGSGELAVPNANVKPGAEGRRVLVVEDNDDSAETLADLLETYGHEIHVARDGRSGIELARTLRPDVVLCDIGLPDIDGYEVARTLRADPSLASVRLVALSGYAQPEDVERSREAGFEAHLAKPPKVAQLVGALAGPSRAR